MHTATRLAVPVIARVRELNPAATLCAFGLYAPLNVELLRELGVEHVLGAGVRGRSRSGCVSRAPASQSRERRRSCRASTFRTPERDGLPPLARYAHAAHRAATRKVVGYTEATRGCKHRCRHCPIVPVYDGRFRVVPIDVVLADVRAPGRGRRPAHHVRRSGLLQRHPPRDGGRARGPRRVPGRSPTTSRSRSSTCSQHAARLPRARRDRLRVRDQRGRVGRRRRPGAAGQGAHARGFRAGGRRCAGTPGCRCRRPSSPSRRGRRSAATASCCRSSIGSDWSSRSRRFSSRSGCWSPQARGCSSCPTSRRLAPAFDPDDADVPVASSRSGASTRCSAEVGAARRRPRVGRAARRDLRAHLGRGARRGRPRRRRRARRDCRRAANRLHERAVVLLRRADPGAGSSDLMAEASPRADAPRVLILSATTGYQLRAFNDAAAQLGIDAGVCDRSLSRARRSRGRTRRCRCASTTRRRRCGEVAGRGARPRRSPACWRSATVPPAGRAA